MCPRTPSRTTHLQARHLRHNLTQPEAKLWTYLRAHRLDDLHFRRQYSIGKYIVDFCAPRNKLIIELDGSQHLVQDESDKVRTEYLNSHGYRILRFWNNEIMLNLDGVIRMIELAVRAGND